MTNDFHTPHESIAICFEFGRVLVTETAQAIFDGATDIRTHVLLKVLDAMSEPDTAFAGVLSASVEIMRNQHFMIASECVPEALVLHLCKRSFRFCVSTKRNPQHVTGMPRITGAPSFCKSDYVSPTGNWKSKTDVILDSKMNNPTLKQQKNTTSKPYKKAHKPVQTGAWTAAMREAFMAAIKPLDGQGGKR